MPLASVVALRLLRMITLFFGVSVLAFALVYNSPIDPIQAYIGAENIVSEEQLAKLREYWGLDKSPVQQYWAWITSLAQGDFGMSKLYHRPVAEIIQTRFWASVSLMGVSWVIAGVFGYALGVIAGMSQGGLLDKTIKFYAYVLVATPSFWLGMVFLIVFSVWCGWFPVGLAVPPGVAQADVTFLDRLHHFVLPCLTLSALGVANIAMHTRAKVIDVMQSDYIAFARTRGERGFGMFRNHVWRNSIIPMISLQFAYFSELFGGSMLAEVVFSYPGLGSTLTEAGLKGDTPLLLGIVIIVALFVFLGNQLANLLTTTIDPRTRVLR